MKREDNATVTPAKPTVVDLDDVPDEVFDRSDTKADTKRKRAPAKAPGKKQKLATPAQAQPSEDEDSGILGDGNDDGAPAEVVEAEELAKDDIECSFIESSRIPSHVAKKDYPHRYVENDGQVCVSVICISRFNRGLF